MKHIYFVTLSHAFKHPYFLDQFHHFEYLFFPDNTYRLCMYDMHVLLMLYKFYRNNFLEQCKLLSQKYFFSYSREKTKNILYVMDPYFSICFIFVRHWLDEKVPSLFCHKF